MLSTDIAIKHRVLLLTCLNAFYQLIDILVKCAKPGIPVFKKTLLFSKHDHSH